MRSKFYNKKEKIETTNPWAGDPSLENEGMLSPESAEANMVQE